MQGREDFYRWEGILSAAGIDAVERDYCCKKEREIKRQAPERARGNPICTEELPDCRRASSSEEIGKKEEMRAGRVGLV